MSPSATSPSLSSAPPDGLFFRACPADAREGQVMADVRVKKDIKQIG